MKGRKGWSRKRRGEKGGEGKKLVFVEKEVVRKERK